jgi:signal transduction histidine kinase
MADNNQGRWAKAEATWGFSIRPVFYRAPWFIALGCAASIGVIYGAWRLRLRQMRRHFSLLIAERVRLSREIHDTLLQSLVGVALQCDVIARELDDTNVSTKDTFVRMRKELQQYILDARQCILDLRSYDSAEQNLETSLRDAGASVTAGKLIAFEFSAAGVPLKCRAAVREQLVRICREALLNVLHHAHAQRVSMELRYCHTAISVTIRDDGCGFDLDKVSVESNGHYGLFMMKESTESIGGEFAVVSDGAKGTRVDVVVPANAAM